MMSQSVTEILLLGNMPHSSLAIPAKSPAQVFSASMLGEFGPNHRENRRPSEHNA
jgi:hypothetical protein